MVRRRSWIVGIQPSAVRAGASLIPISDAELRHRTFPFVNITLIGLNALVFLYELLLGGLDLLLGGGNRDISQFFGQWGFIPKSLTESGTWVTIFSSMFIHGGAMHFLGNMLFLWVFGDNIEDRLGHFPYLAFYLFTGAAATLAHWFTDSGSAIPLVGASGAISGVMGAYLLLYPYNRIKVLVLFLIITVVQLPAMYLLGAWFLLQLVNGAMSLGLSDQVDVAFLAHVGGFLAGAAVMVVYKMATKQPIWPSRRPPSGGGSTRYWRGRPLD